MLNSEIESRKSFIEGKGLFAKSFIPKDTIVWQLDKSEKQLTLEELHSLPEEIRKLAYQYRNKFIVVTDGGQFVNHSCDPNTWPFGDDAYAASRDIQPEEEVTYDYATSDISPESIPDMICHCKAINCRKVITSNDCLNPEFQKRYKNHLPSWVTDFIKQKSE